MSATVNPNLLTQIRKVGAFDISACFNCGNCTAICPLSKEGEEFPRKIIRYATVGLEEKLLSSPELWSCYYCGECTETCPREADPGAFMMAARRYAIRKYSWGRISDAIYSSQTAFYGTLLVLSIILGTIIVTMHGPITLPRIDLFTFIPMATIDKAGMAMGVFVGLSAIANLMIMNSYLSRNKRAASASELVRSLPSSLDALLRVIVDEVAIQKRLKLCTDSGKYRAHLLLVWGFMGLLAATTLAYMIDGFNVALPYYVPRIVGVVSGLSLVYGSLYFLHKRVYRKEAYTTYSHFSDWAFLGLLLLTGITGFLLDVFMLTEMSLAAYLTYAVHLVVIFDLLTTAPFTKFVHALYRPLALWQEELSKARVASELSLIGIPAVA
ncbi:MAG TPA: 4Fe-4S dicluster domain-containing protein [Terriglobales bacterium]|nr:4Fe-4S dicluster domain-containing protein [Terriglobales bacterium]